MEAEVIAERTPRDLTEQTRREETTAMSNAYVGPRIELAQRALQANASTWTHVFSWFVPSTLVSTMYYRCHALAGIQHFEVYNTFFPAVKLVRCWTWNLGAVKSG
jgi:hypothetical protein